MSMTCTPSWPRSGSGGAAGSRNIAQLSQNAPGSREPARVGDRNGVDVGRIVSDRLLRGGRAASSTTGRRGCPRRSRRPGCPPCRVLRWGGWSELGGRQSSQFDDLGRVRRVRDVDQPEAFVRALDGRVAPEREVGVEDSLSRRRCCRVGTTLAEYPIAVRFLVVNVLAAGMTAPAVSGSVTRPTAIKTTPRNKRCPRISNPPLGWMWTAALCHFSASSPAAQRQRGEYAPAQSGESSSNR